MNVHWERIASFTLSASAVVALVIVGPTSGAAQKGKGNKNTKDVSLIATFRSQVEFTKLDFLRHDGVGMLGEYRDDLLQPGGSWVNFPPTGNFTMKTSSGKKSGGRELVIDLSQSACAPPKTWIFEDNPCQTLAGGRSLPDGQRLPYRRLGS